MSESIQNCEEVLPVIDIDSEHLTESNRSRLYEACSEWGLFYIRNHGVSPEFHRKLRDITDEVMSLLSEETEDEGKVKLKVGVPWYTPKFMLSPYFESFKFLGPNFSASAAEQGFTEPLFGHRATQLSNLLEEYGSKMLQLSKQIIKLLLKILGDNFENKFYDPEFSNCNGYIRMNRYSPRDSNEEVEGFGMHTDISCVTILFQDDVGGLQMRSKRGEWMDVRPIEGALVVNIGDFMQAWSNERLRSAEHKVVLRQNVQRFSLAFFLTYGDDDKEICAPNEVVGEGNTRLYKAFSTREYRAFREYNYGKIIGVSVKEFAGIVE